MQVVVTSHGRSLDAPIDPRFGRARFLLLVDTESNQCSAVDNEINLNIAQGAGIQTGKKVAELGAQALITGHVGPKAFSVLSAGGVAVYAGASGTVADAVHQFATGALQRMDAADAEGHRS